MAWVTRWRCPAPPVGRDLGEVEPLGLRAARAARAARARARSAASAASSGVAHAVDRAADLAPAVVVEAAELRLERRQRRPLAQQLLVERAQLVEGRRGRDAGRGVGLDGVDLGAALRGMLPAQAGGSPIGSAGRRRAPLAERLEAQHRAGHGDVERLGRGRPSGCVTGSSTSARHRRPAGRGPRCPSTTATGPRQVDVVVGRAAVDHGGHPANAAVAPAPRAPSTASPPTGHGHVEQRARRAAHALRVARVDRAPAEQYRRGARRPRRPAAACRRCPGRPRRRARARAGRVAAAATASSTRRPRPGGRSRPARCGVTVSTARGQHVGAPPRGRTAPRRRRAATHGRVGRRPWRRPPRRPPRPRAPRASEDGAVDDERPLLQTRTAAPREAPQPLHAAAGRPVTLCGAGGGWLASRRTASRGGEAGSGGSGALLGQGLGGGLRPAR